jgi:hypothetical protein
LNCSFRPSLPLTFLTTELAFADNEETNAFLEKHQANVYVNEFVMEPLANGKSQRKRMLKLEERQWDAKASQIALQTAKDRLRLIDVSNTRFLSSLLFVLLLLSNRSKGRFDLLLQLPTSAQFYHYFAACPFSTSTAFISLHRHLPSNVQHHHINTIAT